MATSSSTMIDLPSHIVEEILSRLPIKALMTSRCVCRSWYFLISDAYFAKLHMTRGPNELFLRARSHEDVSTALFLPDLLTENEGDLGKLNVVFELPRFSVSMNLSINFNATSSPLYMVNCCNGFICYNGPSTNRFAVIWNPISTEFLVYPAPGKEKDFKLKISHGFGFSPKINKYKLLRMVHWYDLDYNPIGDTAQVITLQKDADWKIVEDKPYWLTNPLCPTFLGNSIHWLCNDDSRPDTIVSFDFDNEQFGKVPPPPHLVKSEMKKNSAKPTIIDDLRLGILDNCLCISADTRNSATDIWVMKKFGVPDSWTKVFSIERYYPYNRKENYEVMQCLGSGEIVIALNGTHLFLYDRVKGTKVLLGFGAGKLERIVFKPSLFLIDDITNEEDTKLAHNFDSRFPVYGAGRRVAENPLWWTVTRQI